MAAPVQFSRERSATFFSNSRVFHYFTAVLEGYLSGTVLAPSPTSQAISRFWFGGVRFRSEFRVFDFARFIISVRPPFSSSS
jgi:hypothetical protein